MYKRFLLDMNDRNGYLTGVLKIESFVLIKIYTEYRTCISEYINIINRVVILNKVYK